MTELSNSLPKFPELETYWIVAYRGQTSFAPPLLFVVMVQILVWEKLQTNNKRESRL